MAYKLNNIAFYLFLNFFQKKCTKLINYMKIIIIFVSELFEVITFFFIRSTT